MATVPDVNASSVHFRDIMRSLREGAIDGREALFQIAARLKESRGLTDQAAFVQANTTIRQLLAAPNESSYRQAEQQDAMMQLGDYQNRLQVYQRELAKSKDPAYVAHYTQLINSAQQGIGAQQQRLQRLQAGPTIPEIAAGMSLPERASVTPPAPAPVTGPPPPPPNPVLGPPAPPPPEISEAEQLLRQMSGTEQGRGSLFSAFLQRQLPTGASGLFEDFLERQGDPLGNLYATQRMFGDVGEEQTFDKWLASRGGVQPPSLTDPFRSFVNRGASLLSGPESGLSEADLAAREQLKGTGVGGQSNQFNIALQSVLGNLNPEMRGWFQRAARRGFDRFLADDPTKNFLPWFQGRNFRFF